MQDVFNNFPDYHQGIGKNALWENAREGMLQNIKKLKQYYGTRNYAVKNTHLLARLLDSVVLNTEGDVGRFYNRIYEQSLGYENIINLISSTSRGRIHYGTFFGGNNPELIIANTSAIDPYSSESSWRDIRAVEVVYHNKTDVNLTLPNGKKTTLEDGVSVVSVNVASLLLQYRCFLRMCRIRQLDLSSKHFIHMFVLPNMLYSYVDLAIVNRVSAFLDGAPITPFTDFHAIAIIDYSRQINKVLLNGIENLKDRSYPYQKILEYFHGIDKDNFKEILMLPDEAPTSQIKWVLDLSRLDAIIMLLKLGSQKTNDLNQHWINVIRKEIIALRNNHSIENNLPPDISLDVSDKLSYIVDASA